MAGETFIKGEVVVLSIYDTAASAYQPIACLTSNTLTETVEVEEVQTKCDPGNIVKSAGAYSYEMSVDGIYIDETVDTAKQSHAKLKALVRAKTLVAWRLATGLASPNNLEYGTARITSLELTGEAGQNATFTATLTGSGAIVSVDPEA
jgi:predicted secreted protein